MLKLVVQWVDMASRLTVLALLAFVAMVPRGYGQYAAPARPPFSSISSLVSERATPIEDLNRDVAACYEEETEYRPQFASGQQVLTFDKLSDCNGLSKMRDMLLGSVSTNCRAPHGSIEQTLLSRLESTPGTQACILRSAPTGRLDGFGCIDIGLENGDREITCWREIQRGLLEQYHNQFDNLYSEQTTEYKEAASKCAVGNGDADNAPPSLFPPVLLPVARPNVGFVLGIGRDRKAQAYHGYAVVDPKVDDEGLGAIEIFDIFELHHTGAPIPENRTYSNGVHVEIDDVPEARTVVANNLSRQFGVPAVAKLRFIDLKYGGHVDVPLAKRKSDLDAWQEGIASVLEDAGFREPSRAELNEMHVDASTLSKSFLANLPFGQRNRPDAPFNVSPHVVLLIDDQSASNCGAAADIFVVEPEEGVQVDYGHIIILLTAAGDCRDLVKADGPVSEQLLEKATRYLRDEASRQ